MINDFKESQNTMDYSCDVCIIGAGAAGITLAKELCDTKLSIILVESGGVTPEAETQALYQGSSSGSRYFPLSESRLRMLGGSTNHWEGFCAPFDPLDFEFRDWVPQSGWPISRKDLEPHYQKAQKILGLQAFEYGEVLWKKLDCNPPNLNPSKFTFKFWQTSPSPTRFMGLFHRDWMQKQNNLNVLLHANAVSINASSSTNMIESVRIKNLAAGTALVKAKKFVLACGGIENSRLLLASNDVKPNGIGNEFDQVGRYFMEHPHIYSGVIAGEDKDIAALTNLFDEMGKHGKFGDTVIFPGACVSETLQKQEKILNCSFTFQKMRDPDSAIVSIKEFMKTSHDGHLPDNSLSKLWHIISNIDDLVDFVEERRTGKISENQAVTAVYARSEQAPNPDSRITLTDEKDALGIPRAHFTWSLTEIDRKTIKVATQNLGNEIGRLSKGRMRLLSWLAEGEEWGTDLEGGYHHMGGTRMSEACENGVVDINCKVHTMDNLYVAGSSTFTTGSYANPTLTLIALAVRLAAHLKDELL